MIYAVYHRYYSLYFVEEGCVEEAIKSIQHGNDAGEIFGLGVIDAENRIVYVSTLDDSVQAIAFKRLEKAAVERGMDISGYEVRYFHTFPHDEDD